MKGYIKNALPCSWNLSESESESEEKLLSGEPEQLQQAATRRRNRTFFTFLLPILSVCPFIVSKWYVFEVKWFVCSMAIKHS